MLKPTSVKLCALCIVYILPLRSMANSDRPVFFCFFCCFFSCKILVHSMPIWQHPTQLYYTIAWHRPVISVLVFSFAHPFHYFPEFFNCWHSLWCHNEVLRLLGLCGCFQMHEKPPMHFLLSVEVQLMNAKLNHLAQICDWLHVDFALVNSREWGVKKVTWVFSPELYGRYMNDRCKTAEVKWVIIGRVL